MKRIFFFTLRLAIFVAAAVWFVNQSGTARLVWGGYVIETSAAFIGFAALALGFVFYLMFRFWNLLRHGPAHIRMGRKLKKWQQGHDDLTQGLIAIASGDASEAGRRAVHARRLLGTTISTQLLHAQAAQLAGDGHAAHAIFRALAADPDGAVLGYRGLIMEARREGNWSEVERLVEKLHRLKPETPWLNLTRFEILARRQKWSEANLSLTEAGAARLMDMPRLKKNRAAILVAIAQDEIRQKNYDKALAASEQAIKQAPEWLPAIINLAQVQAWAGHQRAMQRTIEKKWRHHPHPQLAAIMRGEAKDAVEGCKQIDKLCAGNEQEPVSRFVMAEAALAADIWGAARRNLMALIAHGDVTQIVYRLMARLERREIGDEQAALQWLTKAVDAPADPVWLCRSCGGTHTEWQALCRHCGNFNSLEWESPGVSRGYGEIYSAFPGTVMREREILAELISPSDIKERS